MTPSVLNELFDYHPTFLLDIDDIQLPVCKYVDFKDIPICAPVKQFSFLLFNIRSCRKNFNDFECIFYEYFKNFSCIILTETWLTQDFEKLFSIHGFRSFNVYRAPNGGGIRLYCKNELQVELFPEFSCVTDVCEMLTVQISCCENKFMLCVFYHPPSPDHGTNDIFTEFCIEKLKIMQNHGCPIISCGDFNLNLLNPLRYGFIERFIGSMLEMGLYPVVNIPTKYNHENEITKYSIIDHIWTSMPAKVSKICVFPYEITDHFPLSATFLFQQSAAKQTTKIKRVFNDRNNGLFSRLLLTVVVSLINGNMNQTFLNYFSQVWDIYERAFPLIPSKSQDPDGCPWMNPGLKLLIQKKASLYRKYVRGTILKEEYTYFKNRLTALTRRVKRLYYFNLFSSLGNDSSKIWQQINLLLGNRSQVEMDRLQVGNSYIRGKDMVDYANAFFINIANNLTEGLPDEFLPPNRRPNLNSFVFIESDKHEVIGIIKSLKNKGNGLYDISVLTVKKNLEIFSEHMVMLYNFSIITVTYPDLLKNARVVLGYKSGAKDNIDNYRPISNLPLLSKVFEKLTLNRLISFVKKYGLLNDSQFGFREGRDITQAAVKLTTTLVKAYHDKVYACCFFLDLRKAFDTVDHAILLRKMHHQGFRETINSYINSYLSGRKQYVQMGNYKSDTMTISKGVPQGSILGPLLFSLYINDIVDFVEVETVLFADDAAFIILAPTLQGLYDKIKKLFGDLSKYLLSNKLVPNLNKSKLMFFNSRPKPQLEAMLFGDEAIEWVEEFKYLGLLLNSQMSFGCHIDKVCTRISQYIGVFYSLNKILPKDILVLLYHAFILPHLTLHIVIWGAAPEVHISKLRVKQNRLLRAILGVEYVNGVPQERSINMYNNLSMLTVKNLFKLHLFKFLNLLMNGSLPFFYDLLLRPLLSTHSYNTRAGRFRHPLLICEVERRAIAHQLILLHEESPPVLGDGLTIKSIVKKYKRFLLTQQR